MFLSHYQFPVITRPTRFCPTTSTLIDNIFVNNQIDNSYASIIISDISDHLPIFLTFYSKLSSSRSKSFIKSCRDINNNVNLNKFNERLVHYGWHLALNSLDVNIAYDNFISVFSSIYNECFPIIHKKIKTLNYSKPWITPAIIKATKRKNHLYKNWQLIKSDYALEKYKNYRNKINWTH